MVESRRRGGDSAHCPLPPHILSFFEDRRAGGFHDVADVFVAHGPLVEGALFDGPEESGLELGQIEAVDVVAVGHVAVATQGQRPAGELDDVYLGHLQGYQEADGRVRLIPVVLPKVGLRPALSVKVAELMLESAGQEPILPANRLLRFIKPSGGVDVKPFAPGLDWAILRDRFVFVGSSSESDRVATPFGQLQGVEIHAWAAHALATGSALVDVEDYRFVVAHFGETVPPEATEFVEAHPGPTLPNVGITAIAAGPERSDPGTPVTISATVRNTGRGEVDGAVLVFEVADNGVGMDYEVKKRIFTNFFSTKGSDRGTGLGLLTTRKIVQEHGGRVSFESSEGEGSVFRLEFPRDRLPRPGDTKADSDRSRTGSAG